MSSIIQSTETEESRPPQTDSNFLLFIIRPVVILSSLPHIISCCVLGFIDVAISPHLLQVFDIDGKRSGYVFFVFGFTFAIACPLVSAVVSRGFGSYEYVASTIVTCLVFFFLFIPNFVQQLEQLAFVILSLGILGVLLAMTGDNSDDH